MVNLDYNQLDRYIRTVCIFSKTIIKVDIIEAFRGCDLGDEYFYQKYVDCNKNFAHWFLNMSEEYKMYVLRFINFDGDLSLEDQCDLVSCFLLFSYNWSTKGNFFEIVFGVENAIKYYKMATGKNDPKFISSNQICRFYLKLSLVERINTLRFIFEVYDPDRISLLKSNRVFMKQIKQQQTQNL